MSQVLVVHADAAVGARLTARLSEAGLEARAVTSGERAMDRFIQEPVEVVVIDYHLEGRDGVSTAEAIRWMPGGRRARLILTAAREPDEGTLGELSRLVEPFMVLLGEPDAARLRAVVERAAAERPQEAETRILQTDDSLVAHERARAAGRWEDSTRERSRGDVEIRQSALLDDEQTLDEPPMADWEFVDPDGSQEAHEVRQLVESIQDTHSAIVGAFERTSFGRLLHRLAEKRATGALICVHPPDERATTGGTEPTKVVYFRAGVPVHVRSNLVAECLGQVLTRQRKIGPAALKASIEAMRRGEGRQGELLVSMGALLPMELTAALADQLRRKLFELFGWRRGTFRFAVGRPPPRELIDLEMGLAEIAVYGVRQEISPARAREILEPSRNRYAIPQPRKMLRFVSLRMEDGLRDLVLSLDGSQRVGELLAQAPQAGAAAQLLVAMECLEAIRLSDEPRRRTTTQVRTVQQPPVDELPSLPHAAVLRADSSVVAALSLGGAHLSSVDHGVESGAWGDELTPIQPLPRPEPEARASEDAGPAAAAEALGPPEAIAPATGERPTPASRAEPSPSADPMLLPLEHAADTPDEDEPTGLTPRTGLQPLAGEPTHAAPELGSRLEPSAGPEAGAVAEARELVEDVEARAHAPAPGEAAPAEEPREASSPDSVAPASSPAQPEPRSSDYPESMPPPSGEALDDRVERLFTAERHARRGQRALERGRAAEALAALERAVGLCPDEAHLLALRAWARHRAQPREAPVLSESLAEVERACALEPGLALAHGLHARLLTAADRADEANLASERGRALDPQIDATLDALSG